MRKALYFLALLILGACSEVPSGDRGSIPETAEAAPPPFGFYAYCDARATAGDQGFHDAFCHPAADAGVVQLTPQRAHRLIEVQQSVNAAIVYHPTETWSPLASEGDCKTYVARKELMLLADGWPAASMRIATAFINDGSPERFFYHAVLLIRTDQGTLVLDSRRRRPSWWNELPYIWMNVQARDGAHWLRLAADPTAVKTALAANAAGGSLGARSSDRDSRYASHVEPNATAN